MDKWVLVYQEPEDEDYCGVHAHYIAGAETVMIGYFGDDERSGCGDQISLHYEQLKAIMAAVEKERE